MSAPGKQSHMDNAFLRNTVRAQLWILALITLASAAGGQLAGCNIVLDNREGLHLAPRTAADASTGASRQPPDASERTIVDAVTGRAVGAAAPPATMKGIPDASPAEPSDMVGRTVGISDGGMDGGTQQAGAGGAPGPATSGTDNKEGSPDAEPTGPEGDDVADGGVVDCRNPLAEGMPCDAAAQCTINPVCSGGSCVGEPRVCPLPDGCVAHSECSEAQGGCSYWATAEDRDCAEGRACFEPVSCGLPKGTSNSNIERDGCAYIDWCYYEQGNPGSGIGSLCRVWEDCDVYDPAVAAECVRDIMSTPCTPRAPFWVCDRRSEHCFVLPSELVPGIR